MTEFTKIDPIVTFCISINTNLKYSRHYIYSSPMLDVAMLIGTPQSYPDHAYPGISVILTTKPKAKKLNLYIKFILSTAALMYLVFDS